LRNNSLLGMVKRLVVLIDYVNLKAVNCLRWLLYVLMLIIVYDVILRYVFSAPTNWSFHISYMIGGTICAMGAAYTLQIDRHVHIDILYRTFPLEKRLLINIIGMLVLFFPAMFFLTKFAWIRAINAWIILEKGSYGFWYPPIYPYRTIIAIGFTLLLIQGLAVFIRDLHYFLKKEKLS